MYHKRSLLSCVISLALLSGCNSSDSSGDKSPTTPVDPPNPPVSSTELPYFADWPEINSAVAKDPVIEERIIELLSQMTLEEKVGQMIQPNLTDVTPAEAKQYKTGSLLNGGGSWPDDNKHATAQDWALEADKFYLALEEAYADRGFRIPFIWATVPLWLWFVLYRQYYFGRGRRSE